MSIISIVDIGEQLRANKFAVLSWQSLGLNIDDQLSTEIIQRAPILLSTPGQDGDDNLHRSSSVLDRICLAAAKNLAGPIIEKLFAQNQEVQDKFRLFGVNYYNQGDYFPFHRDFNNLELATTAILSLSGIRTLTIEDCSPLRLSPGNITLIDGGSNPLHSASCIEGPSVSVVVDIPSLLY